MDREHRLRRLRFRAWHRGTKEADLLIGGYFDAASANWDDREIAWFETLLAEEDVEIMSWALGTAAWPQRYLGSQQEAMMRLDYIPIER
jgi:antitoxin CptB